MMTKPKGGRERRKEDGDDGQEDQEEEQEDPLTQSSPVKMPRGLHVLHTPQVRKHSSICTSNFNL